MYSLCESGLDHLESEQLLPTAGIHGAVNPMIAGALSGLVYKSTGALSFLLIIGMSLSGGLTTTPPHTTPHHHDDSGAKNSRAGLRAGRGGGRRLLHHPEPVERMVVPVKETGLKESKHGAKKPNVERSEWEREEIETGRALAGVAFFSFPCLSSVCSVGWDGDAPA